MSTILVVEDEVQLRRILTEKLSSEGFEVSGAVDGLEGIEKAIQNHPDLILLDLLMPKIDGIAALEKIRSDSWGKDVPVLILTNLSEVDKVEKAKKLNISGYLVKSDWKLEDVVSKIREVLSGTKKNSL